MLFEGANKQIFCYQNENLNILIKMRNQRSNDSNFLLRAFFVHCFIHIYQMISASDARNVFRSPRFQLFEKISNKIKKSSSNFLFKNILVTFKWHILRGALMTCAYVFFNLLVPELIKMFMHFMHGGHSQHNEVKHASIFIRNLVGVQILRTVFGEHTRRIFHQLAIKVESSLAKMLVQKSLNLSQKARKDVPHSHILQLENVDLKLVFAMFNNMMYIFQAPITIFVALIMLFVQNRTYGFIGAYWFLIAFLLHRELDNKMTHCNATKLRLIDNRSKINYQMLFGMRQARIIGWEDVMIQKNNDLFEEQNHDHYLFYFYNSLYDIILLMLPVLVVVTICLWDMGQSHHITVEQVYMMLSLLGICYQPMKSIRTISISFHDGLHSLDRIQQYFNMPDQYINKDFINDKISLGHLFIQKDTSATYHGDVMTFFIKTNFAIEGNPGQRITIIGRRGQGRTAFISMICGFMKKIQGSIRINGKKATILQKMFFLKSNIRDNIAFYNQNASLQQIDQVCHDLQITEQLKKSGGLNSSMDDIQLFSKSLLKRISIARVLCSGASIYILDNPFQFLQSKYHEIVQNLLRQKQQNKNVLVIVSKEDLFLDEHDDKVAIIQNGIIIQFGLYSQLAESLTSKIKNYFSSKQQKLNIMSPTRKSPLKNRFKNAIRKVTAFNKAMKAVGKIFSLTSVKSDQNNRNLPITSNIEQMKVSRMLSKLREKGEKNIDQLSKYSMMPISKNFSMLKKFVFSVPKTQILFIMIIIICAQFLHVFIHFWIGHLEEEHGDNSYLSFQKMMYIEVILTLGLAGVLYYEGQVSSQIAIIQGNSLYKDSLFSLIRKKISYFVREYPVKIADRFNHDYQQVFVACHGLLTIYKNLIILIVTVIFISSDGFTVLIFFSIIISIYTFIYLIFRKVQKKVVIHYYDYKYGFVKCFEESLQGAQYFHMFGSKNNLIRRAEKKYRRLASYKLAEKYTNHGLLIACDIIGNILLAIIVYYGLQVKIHHNRSNIAVIATSIHLLMNGSQVLKNILKQTINFQTFFRINLVPFLQISQNINFSAEEHQKYERPAGFEIRLDSVVLRQPGQITTHKIELKIKENQHILIYETNQSCRNLLLYALTNNLMLAEGSNQKPNGSIFIGDARIDKIHPDQLIKMVGVIMNKNFYFTGTLRDNLIRKIHVNEEEVDQYIKLLKIDEDIEDYDTEGLDSQIHFQNTKVNYQLTKKFAIIRILLYKCKIVIIKDTPAFIGSLSIADLLRKYIPQCTIIKISNRVEAAFGVDKIFHFENSLILQQGTPQSLMAKPTSIIGNKLKDLDMEGFLFKNQVSRAKINNISRFKKRQHFIQNRNK